MQRKGMMVGSGKSGYYNVTGRDPMVHSLSARGIKQPQRGFMSINPAIRRYSNEKLQEGAVKEHIEHPKFTFAQARMIARDHLVHNPRAYGKMPNVNDIIKYEAGEMNDKEELKFFSELIKSGQVWQLQGHYGRTAAALIESGFIDRQGNLTQKSKTFIKQGLGGKCDAGKGGKLSFFAKLGIKSAQNDLDEQKRILNKYQNLLEKETNPTKIEEYKRVVASEKIATERIQKDINNIKEAYGEKGGKMSKKDYIQMARILGESENVAEVHTKYADYAQQDNPRFDRGRFYSAVQKAKKGGKLSKADRIALGAMIVNHTAEIDQANSKLSFDYVDYVSKQKKTLR